MPSFELDEKKASESYARPSPSFEFAKIAFGDLFAIERIDHRRDYGEERFILIAMAGGALSFSSSTRNARSAFD
jgi:hypothetical protein